MRLLGRFYRLSWMLVACLSFTAISQAAQGAGAGNQTLWQIGQTDNRIGEFALAPRRPPPLAHSDPGTARGPAHCRGQ
jgi:hypothetical protein